MNSLITPIGLDLSLTSSGFSGYGTIGTIKTQHKGMLRLDTILNDVLDIVAKCPSEPLCVIEGYSFSSRNSQSHAAGELGGLVRYNLWKMSIAFVDIPPTCRAKFATGRGNAGKTEVMSAISAKTTIAFSGSGADDECDAWILEEIGLWKLGRPRFSWPKSHTDALAKIEWPHMKEADNDM